MGCDDGDSGFWSVTRDFNPRTRMGCDPCKAFLSPELYNFNPRTRVGCDGGSYLLRVKARDISIHAPAWGAT